MCGFRYNTIMSSKKVVTGKGEDFSPKSGNAGEWGEVYAFFKLLGDPILYQCNANLEKNGGKVEFNQIFRKPDKDSKPLCYVYDKRQSLWSVVRGGQEKVISAEVCNEQALILLNHIKDQTSSSKKHYKDSYKFLKEELLSAALKADSKEKKDIELTIIDKIAGLPITCGFSIKSLFGKNPTLFNASREACLSFKIVNMDTKSADEIQGYSVKSYQYGTVARGWLTSVVSRIREKGGQLVLYSLPDTFKANLEYIDTRMPEILSYYLLEGYTKESTDSKESTSRLSIRNINERIMDSNSALLTDNRKSSLYEYKIKKFLEAVALGMKPGEPWGGLEDANGGYIIVKSNGDLVSFLIYDRKLFLEYLFNYTKLDQPSIGKLNKNKKEDAPPIGRIYEKNGELFITLPLQIRFKLNG